ncbi:hypothetical protein WA026_020165 [Henosepilachna vigintioctopunctata]|uniref:Dual oxidase maturation factor 1 n=1 Tax=Henosepilachna vigintioctopunctata TaxID=420089 RepID=A0AAW1U5T8_9CUCU
MKGWFDAFRNDGGPTLYNFNNRTAVAGDVTIITILTIFSTIYMAFLIIFPGIRNEKFATFFTVTLSLFVGATILVSLHGSSWHIANEAISSSYKAFSTEKISAKLGIYVGLSHVNVTLQALHNKTLDIDFNERFVWIDKSQMDETFQDAAAKGLPFPILTVAEYFTLGQDGLSWGSQYRSAGYFAIIMLWTSFAVWAIMNLMLIVVPRYGVLLMTTCGFLLLATCTGYFGMLPEIPLVIRIEGKPMTFCFGWCYWLVVAAGGICLLSGVILTTMEIVLPHSFSTILEVDYDTPYDRHTIIEDSHGKRFQRKRNSGSKLENPSNDSLGANKSKQSFQNIEKEDDLNINTAHKQYFEMKSTEPHWSYSINPISGRNTSKSRPLPRSLSHDTLSTISADLHTTSEVSRHRTQTQHEVSMW